jgi:hypothetical protein
MLVDSWVQNLFPRIVQRYHLGWAEDFRRHVLVPLFCGRDMSGLTQRQDHETGSRDGQGGQSASVPTAPQNLFPQSGAFSSKLAIAGSAMAGVPALYCLLSTESRIRSAIVSTESLLFITPVVLAIER